MVCEQHRPRVAEFRYACLLGAATLARGPAKLLYAAALHKFDPQRESAVAGARVFCAREHVWRRVIDHVLAVSLAESELDLDESDVAGLVDGLYAKLGLPADEEDRRAAESRAPAEGRRAAESRAPALRVGGRRRTRRF